METLIKLLDTLNVMTPLGVIALLVVVLWYAIRLEKKGPATQASVDLIANNHLHGLPEMAETLRRIEQNGAREIELLGSVKDDLAYLKGRLNGRT